MFLVRKFAPNPADMKTPWPPSRVLPKAAWKDLPDAALDVFSNIQVLLGTRRNFSHVFPNFGLSPSDGLTSAEVHVAQLSRELPETLGAYERRFQMSSLEFDVGDDGVMYAAVCGTITKIPGTFTFRFFVVAKKIFSIEFEPPLSSATLKREDQ